MTSILSPQVILLAYWLAIIGIAALFLRLACSLCQAGMPSWPRALISVVLVTFIAYLTFDFTEYLLMRSMQDVVIPGAALVRVQHLVPGADGLQVDGRQPGRP